MVNVRLPFNVTRNFERKFASLGKEVIKELQKGFSSLRTEIGAGIDEAIDQHSDLFIPNDSEAAELGVGEDGSIDTNKINNAWRQLLVKPPGFSASERPTIFSIKKLVSKTGIGTIRITVDEDKLYYGPLSVVETESEINEGGFPANTIPWLMWFIKGKSISGSQFTTNPKRRVNLNVSRTGRGIMIEGGFWDFAPGTNPFPLIEQAIEQLVIEAVERYIERQL